MEEKRRIAYRDTGCRYSQGLKCIECPFPLIDGRCLMEYRKIGDKRRELLAYGLPDTHRLIVEIDDKLERLRTAGYQRGKENSGALKRYWATRFGDTIKRSSEACEAYLERAKGNV